MRPRRLPSLGLALAAGLILASPAQADLCSRLPNWAEAPCQFLGGWFGEAAVLAEGFGADPAGRDSAGKDGFGAEAYGRRRLEAATGEDGFGMDPAGRVVPPPPGSQLVAPSLGEEGFGTDPHV